MISFVSNLSRYDDGSNRLAGYTIAQIRDADETVVAELLGLGGNETVEVSSNNGPWNAVPNTYTLRTGDTVRFTVQAGEKGLA